MTELVILKNLIQSFSGREDPNEVFQVLSKHRLDIMNLPIDIKE